MKTATMKKARLLTALLAVIMVCAIFGIISLTVNAEEVPVLDPITVTIDNGTVVTLKDGGDNGEDRNGFYDIKNADDLYAFAAAVNGGHNTINGELTADITVNDDVLLTALNEQSTEGFRVWTPIGEDKNSPFKGSFNGKGYTVSGLYYEDTGALYIGLFGYVTKNTAGNNTIANVGVKDSYFHANRYVGAVVGYSAVDVVNCYNDGSAVFGNRDSVGGVVGYNEGAIINCYNTGEVSGDNHIGGIVGDNEGLVTKCYNVGAVTGNNGVGGIAGVNNGTVEVCYNTGAVKANIYVGGVVGDNYGNVTSCYNIGSVGFINDGDAFIGGIVGGNYKNSEVKRCYYLVGCVNSENATDIGTAKSLEAFKSGEVTYLLNGSTSEGALNWYQSITIPGVPVDALPQFVNNRYVVYYHPREAGTAYEYSNHDHDWTFEAVGNQIKATCANHSDNDKCHWNEGNGGTLTLEAPDKVYDSQVSDVKYVYSEDWYFTVDNTLVIDYYVYDAETSTRTPLSDAPVNVGSYYVEIIYTHVICNYYEIEKETIADDDVTVSEDLIYDRGEHKPGVEIKVNNLTLVEDRDYTVTFMRDGVVTDDFTTAGIITIIIEGIGNYKGTVETEYEIKRPEIKDEHVSVSGDMIYDSFEHVPTISVVVNGLTLVKDVDYIVIFERDYVATTDFTNAGAITITIKGINNYIGEVTKTYTIERAEIVDNERLEDDVYVDGFTTYNGMEQIPTVMVKLRRLELQLGIDYTVTFLRNDAETTDLTSEGTITVIIEGIGNFWGTVTKYYVIQRAEITEDDVTVSDDVIYNQAEQKPEITVVVGGLTLVKDRDYTVTFKRGNEVTDDFTTEGTITIIIEGIGNYCGTVEKTYVIKRAEIIDGDVTVSGDMIYDANEHKPAITVAVNGLTLVKDRDYTVTFKRGDEETDDFTNAGTITIIVEGINNYIGTVEKIYVIERAEIIDNDRYQDDVYVDGFTTYNGLAQLPTILVQLRRLELELGIDYTVTYLRNGEETDDFTNEGTITVIIEGIGNFWGTVTKYYVIQRAAINLDDATISPDTIYNTLEQKPEIAVVVGNLTLVKDRDYTVTFKRGDEVTDDFTNAGTITIIIEGIGNYQGTVIDYYVIDKAKLELNLSSPVTVVCPGNNILLWVDSNSNELASPSFNNEMFTGQSVSGDHKYLQISVSHDFVFGFNDKNEYEITIIVHFDETANYYANSASITLKVRDCDCEPVLDQLEEAIKALEAAMKVADADLQAQIEALEAAIKALEDAHDEDVANLEAAIVTAKNEIATAIAALEASLNAKIEDLQEQINVNGGNIVEILASVTDIYTLINELQEMDMDIIATLAEVIEKAENELAEAVSDLKDMIEEEVEKLQNQINFNDADIADIYENIATINGLINALKNADNALDGKLADAIKKAENELAEAVSDLKDMIEEEVEKLQNQITSNDTDIADIYKNIATINGLIEALQAADVNNKAELEAAINAAKEAINTALAELDNRVTEAEKEIDELRAELIKFAELLALNGIDPEQIDTSLVKINASLKALANKDVDLTEELALLRDALDTLTDRVTNNEVNISANASAIANLNTTVGNLAAELRGADADLANSIIDLQNALSDLTQRVEAAEQEIEKLKQDLADAIDALNKAIEAGDKALSDEIAALNKALAAAKEALEATHEEDVKSLTEKIEAADKALAEAIATVQKNLDELKNTLGEAIANGDKALADEIAALNAALEAAKAALEAAHEEDVKSLTEKIEAADKVLEAAIAAVQKNLDDAKAELNAAIAAGDKALEDKIAELNAALESAQAALEAAHAADVTALNAKIDEANAALEAAIAAVQKNLDDAKAELNAAIAAGDKTLDDKIAALNAALDAAKAALEAADAADKAELVSKIEEADEALQAAIDALSAELGNVKNELENLKNELENLKNELTNTKTEIETTKTNNEESDTQIQTVATAAAVTSGVTLIGGGAAGVWLLISKKKKLL